MIKLTTPRGLPVNVPEVVEEDPSARFDATDKAGIKRYYEENGYVIVKGLISAETCQTIRGLWDREVKPYRGFMYRQATAKAETHTLNDAGWVMNPILNLQSVDPRNFPKFREFATQSILTSTPLRDTFAALFGESPKVVQSMYFEGNSATWEHQDSYYLDSEVVGEMAASWLAIEDISARAGRFFICPGSHKIRLDDHSLYNNIAVNHEAYIQSVVKKVKELNLEIRAPALRKGDVLFWNSWTIHGSLDSQDPMQARSSITCHAIPRSRQFLQFQMRKMDLETEDVNGVALYRPKDLASLQSRAILYVESRFPRLFYWLKKKAIVFLAEHRDKRLKLTTAEMR